MRLLSVLVLASILLPGACREVRCCDLGVHAKVAAEVAEGFKSSEWAFVEGFASHIALDYLTYGSTFFWGGEVTQDKDLLAIAVVANSAELYQVYRKYKKTKNKKYLYAAIGGIAPDLIEGLYRMKSRNDDDHLFPWHDRRHTLIFDDPAGAPGVHRKSAKLNIALTLATYELHF